MIHSHHYHTLDTLRTAILLAIVRGKIVYHARNLHSVPCTLALIHCSPYPLPQSQVLLLRQSTHQAGCHASMHYCQLVLCIVLHRTATLH